MRFNHRIPAILLVALIVLTATWLGLVAWAAEKPAVADGSAKPNPDEAGAPPAHTTENLEGKVVWLNEALKRRYGVKTETSLAESAVALETADGKLYPIVGDTRGKAFMVDKRLRDMPVELAVRRYKDLPLVQVMRVYHVKPEGKSEVDYWCDLCAIPMVILKQCECCQGPTRLRERPAKDDASK